MGVDEMEVDEMRTYWCEILCYHYHVSTANMSEGIEQNKKSWCLCTSLVVNWPCTFNFVSMDLLHLHVQEIWKDGSCKTSHMWRS